MSIFMFCCDTAVAASSNVSAANPEMAGLTDYPRIEHFEQGSVQVDFPTLESWPGFRFLKAWLPVEVSLKGDNKPRVGSVYVQALTNINFEQRTVSISDLKVLKIRFSDADKSDTLTQLVSMAFQGRERTVPLDVLLRLLPENFEIPGKAGVGSPLSFDPPVILVSETPLQLLSIDKEPVKAAIEGTELEYVVNTNWNVFYSAQDGRWYVLNDKTWQSNNFLANGGWVTTDNLPSDFDRLALSDRWKEVQKAMPASKPSSPPIPFSISLQATELILLDGAPSLRVIEKTGIRYVNNTESDLFNYGDRWYFLVSGRWFSNKDLDDQWKSVQNLPDAFAQIPSDHKKAHVLYSVPGTRQARLALIEAALPRRVSVARGAAAKFEVTWIGEPRFEAIETTLLQRGLNTPYQVIKHNNFYYLCFEGAWFLSSSPYGPWKVAQRIPDEMYRIPATDPAFNVTFVRLGTEQPETQEYVNYDYSAGYTGSFSTKVSVVYGTGWHYPSSVYWGSAGWPAYWNYGSTYGYNVGYHPVGAYYGGRMGYRGRWGGYGGWGGYSPWGWGGYSYSSITIESPTVDFTHGYGSAWDGPLQTTPGDPAENADRSLDKFLPKKKSDGKDEFIDTSKDGVAKPAKLSASSLYASTSLSSNRFAGPDGEVYKHEDEEWHQYSDGNWNTMQNMEQDYRNSTRSHRKPETQQYERLLPAHKRTLSRSELDQQELARLEGMDNYSKYRMEKESGN